MNPEASHHPRRTWARPVAALLAWAVAAGAGAADDFVTARLMSMELARDIAQAAVLACREEGYQVAAVVVDRAGNVQVALRDVHASRFNLELATKKANASILASVSTGEFLVNRPTVAPIMNYLDDVVVLRGALVIRAAGALVGAVGVSGAHGGELDEKCARKAMEQVSERIEFADF